MNNEKLSSHRGESNRDRKPANRDLNRNKRMFGILRSSLSESTQRRPDTSKRDANLRHGKEVDGNTDANEVGLAGNTEEPNEHQHMASIDTERGALEPSLEPPLTDWDLLREENRRKRLESIETNVLQTVHEPSIVFRPKILTDDQHKQLKKL